MAVRASNSKTFTFRKSKIWEGSRNNLDEFQEPIDVKHKNETVARNKLPDAGMGRSWILVAVDGKEVKK